MDIPLRQRIAWCCLALPIYCGCAGAADYTLRIMAQESLPPKWIRHQGKSAGECPDILAALEKAEPRLHFSGTANFASIPMIESALDGGRIDCACALLDTPARRQFATASQALYIVKHKVAAAANDQADIRTLSDLVRLNATIATSRGAGYADQLRALGLEVDDSTGDNLVNLKKIIGGHGRFFYMNQMTLEWIVRENRLGGQVRILPAVLKEEPVYFWVSKQADPAAARLLEQALQKIRASGELARINQRWLAER
jgi:glutamate/aspartate transport system substrate-binding protein